MDKKQPNIRLPKTILPLRYDLTIQPDLQKFTFSGNVAITIAVKKPTKKIVLHAKQLTISSAYAKNEKEKIASVTIDEENETVTLKFKEIITTGKSMLYVTFDGVMDDTMRGFYRSKYFIEGQEEYLGVTQFEATDARRSFPCFDEPAMKAVFSVSLVIPKELTAIANTIEKKEESFGEDLKKVTFVDTPIMSTYLLAFIVGKFEYISKKTKEGVLVRVFVTPGKKAQARFALDAGVKILSFFESYFAIQYPLPVMDLIAIPDFAAGAMENWGAVTYRETALLVDEEHSSTANKQWVALVIAHELAHQWFGNLVTMEWWTDIWLNEGFATFIEYLAVDHVFPQWDIWTQFVTMDLGSALKLDGLENTHPIEVEVYHPDEINEIFDAVSYSKGATVIRMLQVYLGDTVFQKGLQKYLKTHAYKNAKTKDLWACLELVSKKPVGKIMKAWTKQAGYPLVTVTEKGNTFHLQQARFFASPKHIKKIDKTLWPIPLSVIHGEKKLGEKILMQKKSITIDKPKDTWTKINTLETSMVRVHYPLKQLLFFEKPISEKTLSGADRLGIIRDAFDIGFSGRGSVSDSLRLLSFYKNEHNYIVWSEIASQIDQLDLLIASEPFYEKFGQYARDIFTPIALKMGWEKRKGEPHTATLLRSTALYHAATYGNKTKIEKALLRFQKGNVPADLRGVVYSIVAQYGDEKTYNTLLKMEEETDLQEEKDRIVRALCCVRNKKLLQKTLDLTFTDRIRSQDAFRIIHFTFINPIGKEMAWEFVKKNWDIILERYGVGGHLLPRFIKPASVFATNEKAKEISAFFKTHKAPGAERSVLQTIEQVVANTAWFEKDKHNIAAFLNQYKL